MPSRSPAHARPLGLRALLSLAATLLASAAAAQSGEAWKVEGAPPGARIVVATFFGELLPGFDAVAEDFEQRTGIELAVQAIPYGSYPLWVRTQILSREPPEALLLESTLMGQYGDSGLLAGFDEAVQTPNPLDASATAAWREEFRFPLLQQARDARGRLWYLPYTQYSVGFFHNRSITDPLGLEPPATWDAMLANFRAVKANNQTAMVTAIKANDAQSVWAAALLLECLMRPRIPEVNLQHAPGWSFDPLDRHCTLDERIGIEERLVAFERGIIDPARSPQFDEATRLMQEFSTTWRPDFLSLDGQEVYELFSKGGIAHTMNGTWYFGTLLSDLELLREVAPEAAFEYGTFPFPELTSASTKLPLAGGINQNAGMRACFIVPRQPRSPWRERAGRLLVHYLTLPDVAQRVFDNSQSWDIPALARVRPKAEADPLMPTSQYAYLPVADYMGYDDQSIGEFWPLWQELLGGRIERPEFLRRLSAQHHAALKRVAAVVGDDLDREFLRRELGRDTP